MKKFFFRAALFFLILFVASCGNLTSEFNEVESDDTEFKYVMTASYGDYDISFYSSQSGGYGAYGQLIRDYCSGSLEQIVQDNDQSFSIASNGTDSKSNSSSNAVYFDIELPSSKISSIKIKAAYSALEDEYVESGDVSTPLGLSSFTVSYTDSEGGTSSISDFSKSKFSGGILDASYVLSEAMEIAKITITASMTKYYPNYSSDGSSEVAYSDLSFKKTGGKLIIYKVIAE